MSYVTLIVSLKKVKPKKHSPKYVSLIDNDISCTKIAKSQIYADQLQDLMSFDGGMEPSDTSTKLLDQTYGTEEIGDSLCNNLENLIHGNLICFSEQTDFVELPRPIRNSTCAIKRNQIKGDRLL